MLPVAAPCSICSGNHSIMKCPTLHEPLRKEPIYAVSFTKAQYIKGAVQASIIKVARA